MNKQVLNRLGLSDQESSVYLALLSGPSNLSKLSGNTGIRRASLYTILPELKELGLIRSMHKGKRELWVAEPPAKLMTLLDKNKTDLENLIPELEEAYQASDFKPIVQYLQGREGVTYALNDIVDTLKKGGIYYRFRPASCAKMQDSYITPRYRNIRKEKELQRFWITNEQTAKQASKQIDRHSRIIPESSGLFDYDLNLTIYADKVAYIDFANEAAVIIENKQIAEFQKHIFKMLYKSLG